MGLAASQARLLTITARKADCEYRSMTLSHQRLQMSRDLERISREYQQSLSATKLVFGYNSGVDMTSFEKNYCDYANANINLTYGALMKPSAYNEYYPKMVTDSTNRCILNETLARAAREAGIPTEGLGSSPSSEVRNRFIEALGGAGVLTPLQTQNILETPYAQSIGLGATVNITQTFEQIEADELMDFLINSSLTTSEAGMLWGSAMTTPKAIFGDGIKNSAGQVEQIHMNNKYGKAEIQNRTPNVMSFDIKTLLSSEPNDQIVVSYCDWSNVQILGAACLQDQLCGVVGNQGAPSFLDYLVEQFSNILGGVAENEEAIAYAYQAVYDMLAPNDDIVKLATGGTIYNGSGDSKDLAKRSQGSDSYPSVTGNNMTLFQEMDLIGTEVGCTYSEMHDKNTSPNGTGRNTYPACTVAASNAVGFTFTSRDSEHHRMSAQVSVSLNNVARTFLTKMVEFLDGGPGLSQYNAEIGYLNQSNLFDINKDSHTFTVLAEAEIEDDDQGYFARFYDAMFNQICACGWVENDDVDDYEYLTQMFKNGQAFISSISNDGYYYQGNYSALSFVSEVTDDEAIARAEAKYNTEKAKLSSKEDTLDMKMKNLDTEIAALTQEYDTAKNLVAKSVDKTFKRYEA